jgi:hypothetical protein
MFSILNVKNRCFVYNLITFSAESILNRTPVFLDYGSNQSFPLIDADLMLSCGTRDHHFQFFVAVTPGTESVLSGFVHSCSSVASRTTR